MQYDAGDMVVVVGPTQSKYGPFAPEGVRGMVDRVDGRGVWVTLLAPWQDEDGRTWLQSDITQLYHPRDIRPSGRRSALMRVASRGCDDGHSWAWLSPTGDFVEVGNHSTWALTNYPDETYAEYERSQRDNPSKHAVSRDLYMALARSAIYGHESFYARPPQDLLQRGRVYQIPEEVRRRADARGMPTLSMGSWPLNKRLVPAEERFLEVEGVYPEVVAVDLDNAWNRKVRKTWEEHHREIYSDTLTSAKKALHKAGWISVANAYSLGGLTEPTAKQWESFFRNVLDCWKAVGIRPPVEREKLDLAVGDRYTEMPYEEAISRYCPRRMQDEIYEYLLEGRPSQTYMDRLEARREREREEYAESLRQRGVDPLAPIPRKVDPPVRPPNPMRERKLRERYPARRASAERIATRHLEAKYDPYSPKSAQEVLDNHLYTLRVGDDELNLDVEKKPSQMGALMNRARKWSLDEFTEYMEKYAWNDRIDELRRSLAAEPLEYRVMVNGKAKGKGTTSEAGLPRLREVLADHYEYRKWADVMEIVTRPRPKADYRKLDALIKARAEREKAWADLYADLRVPKPVLVDGMNTSDSMVIYVDDRGVRVGGILISKEDHTSNLTFTGCEADIRKLVAQYGDGPVWTVAKSTMWPEYRGKGTGMALYLRAVELLHAKGPKPVYLEAHHCLTNRNGVFGTTSEDALRVWKKLITRFPSSGTVIAIV